MSESGSGADDFRFRGELAEISQANVKAARSKLKTSKNYVDRRIAEAEDVREHIAEAMPPVPPKK